MSTSTPSLLRLRQVLERTGLSRSCLYDKVQHDLFPQPCRISERASAWSSDEVDRWIAERLAERDTKLAEKHAAKPTPTRGRRAGQ